MALSATWPQVITLGTASSDTTSATYTTIVLPQGTDAPSSESQIGSQALRIAVAVNGNSGSVTLRFVLTDGTTDYDHVDVVCTATTKTLLSANSGSNYKCTVAGTNDRFIDLIGYDLKNGLYWRVGAQAYTTVTSGTLYVWPTRAT